MKALDMFFLILTLASVLGLRIWQVTPWRATSPLWDETQKHNLHNWLLLLGLTIFMGFVPLPWWMGLILLLPILAVCAWMLSAAYDWDDTTNMGDLCNRTTWGANRAQLKLRLKIRLFAIGGIFALLVFTWISVAITGAFGNGSANNAQPPATTSPATQAPATTAPTTSAAPTTQATTSPAPSPSDSTSATASSKHNCLDDVPVDKAVAETYKTTMGNTLDVCRAGSDWTNIRTKNGGQVQVLKWVQDGTYEYDLIPLDGKQVWIRVPYSK